MSKPRRKPKPKQSTKDPLVEWNRLNKTNAEQGFVSSLFQSMSETTTIVDKFSLWLLAGTGATGALLITQVESVLPYLSQSGIKVCIVLLVLSAVCGFIAKYFSLRCEIQNKTQANLAILSKPIFEKYEEDEEQIQAYAEQRGLQLQTELDFTEVMTEFAKPFPFWAKWLIARKSKQTENNRQAGHHASIKAYLSQLNWTFFQGCLFLLFMTSAAWFANAI